MYLFQFSTRFEQPRAHHQENQLYQYNIWYMSLWPFLVQLGDLHTKRSPTRSNIYRMLYWYNWFSWWWARGCSKRVENWNKYIEKNCGSSWSFAKNHNKMHGQQNMKCCYYRVESEIKWRFYSFGTDHRLQGGHQLLILHLFAYSRQYLKHLVTLAFYITWLFYANNGAHRYWHILERRLASGQHMTMISQYFCRSAGEDICF